MLDKILGKSLIAPGGVADWNGLPREVVDALGLTVQEACGVAFASATPG